MAEADQRQSVLDSVNAAVFSTRKFADSAAEIIRQLIMTGEVQPGERLNEFSLAQRLGISRSPVREAMQTLAGEGLVHLVPGRGAFVVELSVDTVKQLGQIRSALECLGARLAAAKASDQQLDELEESLDNTAYSMESGASVYPDNVDFHRGVLELSGSPQLVEVASTVSRQLRLARLRSGHNPDRARDALEEHRLIVASLKAHDAGAAHRAMEKHLDSALESVVKLLGGN